ncbi:MAG: hypothetical protein Q8L29_02090 [archaeon]|nr:hypothetical protein [archaeon]
MTLILETESHGEVESGFFSTFTQFARLGEHTFATRHLCELIQHLAKNPRLHRTQILSYDLDKFWQRQEDYAQEILQIISEAEQSYLPELHRLDMKRQLERQQGEISIEDDINLYNDGKMIPIRILSDEKFITLGDYKVAALHFGRMAVYFARGGFLGWSDGQKPEFAKPTIDAIKNSRRELYREIRKEYFL